MIMLEVVQSEFEVQSPPDTVAWSEPDNVIRVKPVPEIESADERKLDPP